MASFTSPIASFGSTVFTPDRLIAGDQNDILSRKVTIASGTLVRGSVLGKITLGAATVAPNGAGAAGANTASSGSLTMDASTPLLAGAQLGVYRVMCTAKVADKGTFRVTDPKGNVLGDVSAAITTGTVWANQIKFVLLAITAHDFEVGDGFTVTIAAGSGQYLLSAAAGVDGSAVPDAILVMDTDASGGAKEAMAYFQGTFSAGSLTFGVGHTAATVQEMLRTKGITLVTEQAA
jgi:hypothetical protein